MKKFFLLTKTLLVMTLLCVGASNAWADATETVQVMSENYESYAVGDITSTMQTNGWTFQSKNQKNQITIVQGTGTKYFDFYYPDGGANRNQYWLFPSADLSALTADNWTLTFSAALNPGTGNSANRFDILGTGSGNYTTTSSAATNTFFNLTGTAAAAVTYTVSVGSTTVKDAENAITLTSGTWYKFTIKATNIDAEKKTANIYVKITSQDEKTTVLETTQNNVSTSAIGTLKGLCWNSPRGYSRLSLDDVLLTKEVPAGVCADPTYNSTGANGTSRKFTLACETANSTIYYSETELAAGADGWTEYTGEVTTSAATLYAYAATASANSNVISITTGAGSAVKLVTPTITRNAYNTVTITANQSSLGFDVTPVATIYYTYGGDAIAYSGPITITGDGTITAYASLEGYTTSDNASREVGLYPQAQIENTPQNKSYSSAALSGNTFTTSKATYDALIIDDSQWGENVYVQTSNFNWRNNGDWYINSTSSTWICMKNLKAGEVVVCDASYAASSLVNATYSEKYTYGNRFAYVVTEDGDVEIGLAKPDSKTMCYFYGIYAYSDNYVPVSIGEYGYRTFSNTNNLDFTNVEGLTAYIATARDDVNSTIRMQKVDGIITNTGLVLKGDEGTYNIPISATSGTTYNTSSTPKNYLFAISSDYDLGTSGTGTNYVLSVQEINSVETVVWAPITSDENKASVKAGQAALWIPTAGTSSARGLRMVFDGDVITGVTNFEAAEAAVEKEGKFVINGQLVIKKNGKMFNANGAQMK